MDELQSDFSQVETLESEKTPVGRPRNSKERSNTKRQTRLRVRDFRARKAEEAEEARISQEKLFKDMRSEGLLFWGETAPTINCVSIASETEMARVWAKLLNVRDIQPGENQKAYILEVMKAWCTADCPLLHLESKSLSNRKVDTPDADQYIWPEGSDMPYHATTESETEGMTNA